MHPVPVRTLAAAMLLTALLIAPVHAFAAPDVEAEQVIGGLDLPAGFTFAPGRILWYVEKSTGEIRRFDLRTRSDELFATVDGIDAEGERGLLGIALHPRYPDRPFVYVYATRADGGAVRNQILRFRDEDGAGTGMRVLFSSRASDTPYHNGGRILFGPDGNLWAIVGDGHAPATSQDLDDVRGKIIRLRPNGDVPRTNPSDDPVFAYGIRNGFGLAFDPLTDDPWATDNGPECNDEVNRIRKGRNYGWGPTWSCSGTSPRNTNRDGPDPVLPEWFVEDPIGITGIAFCDGCRLGAATREAVLVAGVNDGRIRRLTLDEDRRTVLRHRVLYDHPTGGVISLEVGPAGRIYFSSFRGIFVLSR